MTAYGEASGVARELSAITIQSLADLGYTVNLRLADNYQVPLASGLAADVVETRPGIDEVIVGPIVVVDQNGRVVRRIFR